MRTYDGLAALVDQYRDRQAEGWILLKRRNSLNDAASLADATFIVGNDEEEEDEPLNTHASFLGDTHVPRGHRERARGIADQRRRYRSSESPLTGAG